MGNRRFNGIRIHRPHNSQAVEKNRACGIRCGRIIAYPPPDRLGRSAKLRYRFSTCYPQSHCPGDDTRLHLHLLSVIPIPPAKRWRTSPRRRWRNMTMWKPSALLADGPHRKPSGAHPAGDRAESGGLVIYTGQPDDAARAGKPLPCAGPADGGPLDPVNAALSGLLGVQAKMRPGRQHVLDAAYFARGRCDPVHHRA